MKIYDLMNDSGWSYHLVITEEMFAELGRRPRRESNYQRKYINSLEPVARRMGLHCVVNRCEEAGTWFPTEVATQGRGSIQYYQGRQLSAEDILERRLISEKLARHWYCYDHHLWVEATIADMGCWARSWETSEGAEFQLQRQDLIRPCGHAVEYDASMVLKPCGWCV